MDYYKDEFLIACVLASSLNSQDISIVKITVLQGLFSGKFSKTG